MPNVLSLGVVFVVYFPGQFLSHSLLSSLESFQCDRYFYEVCVVDIKHPFFFRDFSLIASCPADVSHSESVSCPLFRKAAEEAGAFHFFEGSLFELDKQSQSSSKRNH